MKCDEIINIMDNIISKCDELNIYNSIKEDNSKLINTLNKNRIGDIRELCDYVKFMLENGELIKK